MGFIMTGEYDKQLFIYVSAEAMITKEETGFVGGLGSTGR